VKCWSTKSVTALQDITAAFYKDSNVPVGILVLTPVKVVSMTLVRWHLSGADSGFCGRGVQNFARVSARAKFGLTLQAS